MFGKLIFILVGIGLLVLTIVGVFFFNSPYTEIQLNEDNVYSFGAGENSYFYDDISKIMTASNGMTFKTESNGVITINDERFIAFALKGTVNGSELIRTSMDFDWTWHKEVNEDGVVFWAENDNPNFIWKQYYYFYNDSATPMKIEHYLENNYADISNMEMYYLFNVLEEDNIEYNGTKYNLNDLMPIYKTGNFNNISARMNFNDEYDFVFDDLIKKGFIINKFYVGSGEVLDRPNINISAVGFTKNNGNFPMGSSIMIDPTFSTNQIEGIAVAPVDDDVFVISYCDETTNEHRFVTYYTNGTQINATLVDDATTDCILVDTAVSAFNDTSFVFAWQDRPNDIVYFKVFDIFGANSTGNIAVNNTGSNSYGVGVDYLNETTFAIGWQQDSPPQEHISVYDIFGNRLLGDIIVDSSIGPNSYATSVSSFNSTVFAIGWFDSNSFDQNFAIYDITGQNLTSIIVADSGMSNSFTASLAVFNSTALVYGWYNAAANEIAFAIYDIAGNEIVSKTVVDKPGASSFAADVASINETAFIISWRNTTQTAVGYATYTSLGNVIIPPIEVDVSSTWSLGVASQKFLSGIGICNDNIILAWSNTTSQAVWKGIQSNGTDWDGICEVAPPADTCTCAGLNNDWEIDHSDACTISDDCDLGTGTLSFTGVGTTICAAEIKTTDMGDPGSGGTFQIDSACTELIS